MEKWEREIEEILASNTKRRRFKITNIEVKITPQNYIALYGESGEVKCFSCRSKIYYSSQTTQIKCNECGLSIPLYREKEKEEQK